MSRAIQTTVDRVARESQLIFEEAYAGYIIDLLKPIRSTGKEYYIRFVTSMRLGADPLCDKIRKEFYERKK